MERAKCKSFLSGMLAVQSAVEKWGREMKTKPRCVVPIAVVGTGPPEFWEREADAVRDSHSQKHIVWISKVSLHVSLFPAAVGKAQEE